MTVGEEGHRERARGLTRLATWRNPADGTRSGRSDLGVGYAIAPELGEGRHELTATAPDGLGGLLTERAIIIVGGRPRKAVLAEP